MELDADLKYITSICNKYGIDNKEEIHDFYVTSLHEKNVYDFLLGMGNYTGCDNLLDSLNLLRMIRICDWNSSIKILGKYECVKFGKTYLSDFKFIFTEPIYIKEYFMELGYIIANDLLAKNDFFIQNRFFTFEMHEEYEKLNTDIASCYYDFLTIQRIDYLTKKLNEYSKTTDIPKSDKQLEGKCLCEILTPIQHLDDNLMVINNTQFDKLSTTKKASLVFDIAKGVGIIPSNIDTDAIAEGTCTEKYKYIRDKVRLYKNFINKNRKNLF